jgi:magnesium transporter
MIETIKIGTLRWSHIVRPTDEDLKILKDHYHFHALDLEDCRATTPLRPKIDIYDDYYFMILHFPSYDPTNTFVDIKELKFFWGKDFLISLGKSHWIVKDLFNKEKNQTTGAHKLEVGSSDALLYLIVEHVMKDTIILMDKVDKAVELCGKSLFNKKAEKTIELISITRKNIIMLNTIIKPQLLLFNKLQSGSIEGFAENMEDYWGNILDDYQRIYDMVEDDAELIRGYSMTFDSLQVNKTNEVMKILTLVSSILLPLTFIASLYGMNIKLPLQDHGYSFMIVAGSMAAIAIAMVAYFKLKRWM